MSTHKFQIGQSVQLQPGGKEYNVPAGSYTVQRLLPSENRDFQYRVKNSRDGHERIVRESQLQPSALMR